MRIGWLVVLALVAMTAVGCGCRGQESMVVDEVRTFVEEQTNLKVKEVFAVRDGDNKYRCKVDMQSGDAVIVRVLVDGSKILMEAE